MMIPSIDEIVYGLECGKYTAKQALAWINQHLEPAKSDYRKDVALSLLTGMLCNGFSPVGYEGKSYIEISYAMADDFIAGAVVV